MLGATGGAAVQMQLDLASPGELRQVAIAARARHKFRRRKALIWAARVVTLVVIVGGWQWLTSIKVIDPFFWGQPSGIVKQLSA